MQANELTQRINSNYKTPSDEVVKHLQSIIDEAFGRTGQKDPVEK